MYKKIGEEVTPSVIILVSVFNLKLRKQITKFD